jgi:hypothetical protein
MGFVRPMNVLSHDQDCSEAGQSRPIYDTFPTAASVSKTDAYLAHRAMLVGKKAVISLP